MNCLTPDCEIKLEIIENNDLYKYENILSEKYSLKYICGIDEVGRGPLAGPVVCCAVILKQNVEFKYVNDSKKLSKARLIKAYEEILDAVVDFQIVEISPQIIDEINILNATKLCMKKSLEKLIITPEFIITDFVKIDTKIPSLALVRGDANSISVACASILAKVYRDKLMQEYGKEYPGYGFHANAGYPTKSHLQAIMERGITPIHRKTFGPVAKVLENKKVESE